MSIPAKLIRFDIKYSTIRKDFVVYRPGSYNTPDAVYFHGSEEQCKDYMDKNGLLYSVR